MCMFCGHFKFSIGNFDSGQVNCALPWKEKDHFELSELQLIKIHNNSTFLVVCMHFWNLKFSILLNIKNWVHMLIITLWVNYILNISIAFPINELLCYVEIKSYPKCFSDIKFIFQTFTVTYQLSNQAFYYGATWYFG